MIDGEASDGSPRDESPRLPPQTLSPKSVASDGSLDPSQYSSCLESEYDRYCSANSVMGAPSVCSSVGPYNDCLDSDKGSSSFRDSGDPEFTCLNKFSHSGFSDATEEPNSTTIDNKTSVNSFYPLDGEADDEPRHESPPSERWFSGGDHKISIEHVNGPSSDSIQQRKSDDDPLSRSRDPGADDNPGRMYDDIVHEMEEILLEARESPCPRDSETTTSTTSEAIGTEHPLKILKVEVTGSKQERGNVSLSEKLVGVKEHTVYTIRVWTSEGQWEIERRYRDFCALHHQLKHILNDRGMPVPYPWSCIERESRKIFGNTSTDSITSRSELIQDCLQSIISFSPDSVLLQFLAMPGSPRKDKKRTATVVTLIVSDDDNGSDVNRILELQNGTCAGCGSRFLDRRPWMFGWMGPRLCRYTGKLFCSSCHSNDTAVLPSRVLHHWDFARYPVSVSAKSFLDSIHGEAILDVGLVNPDLLSRVPVLAHVVEERRKIGSMVRLVRCPFRGSIFKGLGSRRYIADRADLFSLKDAVDLSMGAFAAMPAMVEGVRRRIAEHITEQCLVCCDAGVPCGARRACTDPAALIFPFQDGTEKCGWCGTAFHGPCFGRVGGCPCASGSPDVGATLGFLGSASDSGSPFGYMSRWFSRTARHDDSSNVILMGSLPNISL